MSYNSYFPRVIIERLCWNFRDASIRQNKMQLTAITHKINKIMRISLFNKQLCFTPGPNHHSAVELLLKDLYLTDILVYCLL